MEVTSGRRGRVGFGVVALQIGGDLLPSWVESLLGAVPEWAVRLIVALAIMAIAWYGTRVFFSVFGRRIARRFRRPSVTRTVLRSVRTAVLVVAAFAALGVLGVPFSDLTLSVGVFSAVVGIVLAPIVGSVLSGVFVLADQPYEIGDMIELVDSGERGFVEDITLRYTKVFTLDNTFLVVPNGAMRERDVVNYSAEDTRTRLSLDILVTYESDIPAARDLIERAARDVDGVIRGGPDIRVGGARYPAAPTCYIDTHADHGVRLRLRYWVEVPYKLLALRSAVQEAVRERLVDADVEFAYPHAHLVFDETSGAMQVSVTDENVRGSAAGGGEPPSDGTDPA